jgi:hypothetical protein
MAGKNYLAVALQAISSRIKPRADPAINAYARRAPIQHFGDHTGILTGCDPLDTTNGYTANHYRSYAAQVFAAAAKYEGRSHWGGHICRKACDIRAAFIMGGGVQACLAEGFENDSTAKDALKFIERFISENEIDSAAALEWAVESQIEGKFLARLTPTFNDEGEPGVAMRFISWSQHGYTVVTNPNDYKRYEAAAYTVNAGGITYEPLDNAAYQQLVRIRDKAKDKTGDIVILSKDQFVYGRFGGRAHMVNLCPTRIGSVLGNMEALDKALADWREINRLYARPTPCFETETAEQAEALHAKLQQIRWRIGDALAIGAGTFTLKGPDTAGVESIKAEISNNMQVISSATGVPLQYLGHPELLANRATADDISASVGPATEGDRKAWQTIYQTAFRSALRLSNRYFGTNYNPMCVEAEIAEMSGAQMAQIEKTWLPLYDSGVIDDEEMLAHVPNVDIESLLKRKEEAKAEAQAMMQLAGPRAPIAADDDEPAADPPNVRRLA